MASSIFAPQTATPPPAATVPDSKTYLPAIDGLRGLAAMMVVFFHSWGMTGMLHLPEATFGTVTIPFYSIFIPGYSGVYLFFVLSGFCLSYPMLSHPERKFNWPDYVAKRVRRILPAYMISFVALFLIGQWLRTTDLDPSGKYLYEAFNIKRFIKELFLLQKSKVVNSYWTLVLEWRWYLIFPALLLLAKRIHPLILLAAAYGFSAATQWPALGALLGKWTFLPLAVLLPTFVWGIWAAHLAARPREQLPRWERPLVDYPLYGLAAGILWAVCICPPLMQTPIIKLPMIWGPLYFALILAALYQPWLRGLFSSLPMVKLGLISYSIYLLQEPVIYAGHLFIDRTGYGPLRLMAHHYLLFPALCILAGWGLYYIGERPFLNRGRKN